MEYIFFKIDDNSKYDGDGILLREFQELYDNASINTETSKVKCCSIYLSILIIFQ